MNDDWKTSLPTIAKFIDDLKREMKHVLKDNFVGLYIHGSLALGGFNPNRSDVDVLVVTHEAMKVDTKRSLTKLLLHHSNSPYPVEISFLHKGQLRSWQHPCPFDFHYSEFWRERYQSDLLTGTYNFINEEIKADTDLAAHITITNHRGICLEGESIDNVFPSIPRADYLSSIVGDFKDCLQNITDDPIYCTLNLLRVYAYLKDGVISSKLEAGNWGLKILPQDLRATVSNVVNMYTGEKEKCPLKEEELMSLRDYIKVKVMEYQVL